MRLLGVLTSLLVCAAAWAADPTTADKLADLKHADAKTRRLAADALGRAKHEAAIPNLVATLGDTDAAVRGAAARALRRIGPKTFGPQVAALEKLSTADTRTVLESLIDTAPKVAAAEISAATLDAVAKLLADRDTEVRIHATVLLGAIGPPAKAVLPTLLDQLADPTRTPYIRPGNIPGSVSEATARAVLQIEPKAQEAMAKAALPKLLTLLESPDGWKAQLAARVIEKLGPHGRPAEAALMASLERVKEYEGYAIKAALLNIGDGYATKLERTFRDATAAVESRVDALRGLGGLPPAADAKFAALLAVALADDEPPLRAAAVDLCWLAEARAKPVVKDLVRLLGDRALDPALEAVRIGTRDTLIRAIRSAGPDAVPLLADVVANRRISTYTRSHAARALVLFGRTARPARDALRTAMDSDDAAFAAQAARAYLAAGGDLATAEPVFVRALASRSPAVQADALHLVSEVGDRLDSLAPTVIKRLDSGDREVRIAAARALATFGPTAKDAVKTIAARMADGDGRERYQMSHALEKMGPFAVEAVPELVESLDRLENSSPLPNMTCLANVGPGAKAAVPKLVGILTGGRKTEFHMTQAIDVLGAIGPDAHEATPVLVKMLADPKNYRRPNVLKALGRIGPNAKAARPAVEALLDDENATVAAWARFATVRITGTKEPHLTVLRQTWDDQRDLRSPGGGFRFGTDFPDVCLHLGPDAVAFRDLLLAEFLDPKTGVGTQATIARSLGTMPQAADVIVPKVVAAIDNYPRDVFGQDYLTNMVTVLANLGPAAKAAVPRLRKLADECEHDAVAAAAEKAVRKIERVRAVP